MNRVVTPVTILRRAAELLAAPLPHSWACCEYGLGPYCPRCAVAKAKGLLTETMSYDAHDDDLRMASNEIAHVIGHDLTVLTEGEAIAVVEMAIRNSEAA